MTTIELTEEEVLTLKAVFAYAVEEGTDEIGEALEISNEDRGLNEEGEETDDYDTEKDPVLTRLSTLSDKIMNL